MDGIRKLTVESEFRRQVSQRLTLGLATIIIAAGGISGCTGNKVLGNQSDNTTEIQIGDFKGDPNAPAVATQPTQQEPTETEPNPELDNNGDPVLITGTNPSSTRQPKIFSGNDGLEFLDAKVGDISGHPIYVSSFFEPIKDRLTTLGQEKSLSDWRIDAIDIVRNRLDGIIYDELLRAETIAALTPQQRVGLQSFLKDFRSNLLSENLGSAQLANRRILEEQGVTLDEALRQKELDTLVGLTLYQEINRRINISWRDIKQRYERDIEKYQPKPIATLQVIRVMEPEGEQVDSITARLNAGEDFSEIAKSIPNNFMKENDGKIERILTDDFKNTEFYPIDKMNEAAWTLGVGEWAGPVSFGNANFWIKYLSRTQDSKSLYDAQLQIFRELTQERRDKERQDYLTELIERARVSSREEILFRLIYIAEQQFGPAR
tara:strand:+ start:13393 stop:14694 length:1302 start_codon:yes stop_codon:yes gene_type:complete